MKRLLIILAFVVLIAFLLFGDSGYLNLEKLQTHLTELQIQVRNRPLISIFAFAGLYVFATTLCIPISSALSLLAGALFGFWFGSFLALFACTLGATLSFLASRFIFQDWIRDRFREAFGKIESGFRRQGAFYLLTMRLMPGVPFFVINLLMGLTSMRTRIYVAMTALGMLPTTLIYVNAGQRLARVKGLQEIFTPAIVGSLVAVAIVPLLLAYILKKYHSNSMKFNDTAKLLR